VEIGVHELAVLEKNFRHVSQIILALPVSGLYPFKCRKELAGFETVDAGVDLADLLLIVSCVLLFGDAIKEPSPFRTMRP
jgi:hypothetical protein